MPQITKVRTESGWGLSSHEHIAGVQLADGSRETRDRVIERIRSGVHYWTQGGGLQADVVVRGCPYCSFGSYITTLPDSTTTNNLLKLPRYYL